EPTNDLDIETLELLEELLQEYDGTLFLVSHDRRFLDNVVTQTIVAEGNGKWMEYVGGYEEWLRQRPEGGLLTTSSAGAVIEKPLAAEQSVKAVSDAAAKAADKSGKGKLSFKEQKELTELAGRIAALEASIAALQARLADPAIYQD